MARSVVLGGSNHSSQATEQEGESVAESIITLSNPTENSISIDATGCLYDGIEQGASRGSHYYSISVLKNYLDVSGASELVPTIAGANVTELDDSFIKTGSSNSWDSWFQSESIVINPLVEDALITWPVEVDIDSDGDDGADGTIREMGGLDDNPALNNSFSSGEYMLYQYNNSRLYMYENGANKGYKSQALLVGDLMGLRVESGVVSYVHYREGVETVIGVSDKKAEVPLFFKAALNRGANSSGHSQIGDVRVCKSVTSKLITKHIFGGAAETLSDDDKSKLKDLGLDALEGSTYSLVNAQKQQSSRWDEGREYTVRHGYFIGESQSTSSIV